MEGRLKQGEREAFEVAEERQQGSGMGMEAVRTERKSRFKRVYLKIFFQELMI